ncbi:hypothetical protein M5K25_024284 [Dendrobium thyrsiflorum]|uniref:Uncharacterized protein n=1 Tax=Dendrobium thyrsiflorum TaxID=117978 RepID=A0ABD0U1X8_DENTH
MVRFFHYITAEKTPSSSRQGIRQFIHKFQVFNKRSQQEHHRNTSFTYSISSLRKSSRNERLPPPSSTLACPSGSTPPPPLVCRKMKEEKEPPIPEPLLSSSVGGRGANKRPSGPQKIGSNGSAHISIVLGTLEEYPLS